MVLVVAKEAGSGFRYATYHPRFSHLFVPQKREDEKEKEGFFVVKETLAAVCRARDPPAGALYSSVARNEPLIQAS